MTIAERLRAWWWRLWTGCESLEAKRRAIEQDVVRFGGTVTWSKWP